MARTLLIITALTTTACEFKNYGCDLEYHNKACVWVDPILEGENLDNIEPMLDRASLLTGKSIDGLKVLFVHPDNWARTVSCHKPDRLGGCAVPGAISIKWAPGYSVCSRSELIIHELMHLEIGLHRGHRDHDVWGHGGVVDEQGAALFEFCGEIF